MNVDLPFVNFTVWLGDVSWGLSKQQFLLLDYCEHHQKKETRVKEGKSEMRIKASGRAFNAGHDSFISPFITASFWTAKVASKLELGNGRRDVPSFTGGMGLNEACTSAWTNILCLVLQELSPFFGDLNCTEGAAGVCRPPPMTCFEGMVCGEECFIRSCSLHWTTPVLYWLFSIPQC